MAEVLIRYCVPCHYQPKAMQDADAILKEFGPDLSSLRLVPGDHGVYDIEVDGQLIWSMDQATRFPETPELIATIRKKIGAKASRKKA